MEAKPVRLRFVEPDDDSRVVVEWIMSSVCNYACSYCPVYLHDGRVRWPRYDDIIAFCHRVRHHYQTSRLTFLLSGGEITLYRHLKPLTQQLKSLQVDVAILTNGSRPLPWWRAHTGLFDEVIISYHHEHADDEHVLAVARLLTQICRVQINVVIDPMRFGQTMAFADRVEAETSAVANRKIMFVDGWKRPAVYNSKQRRQLDQALAYEHTRTGPTGIGSVLKGDLVLEYDSGQHRALTALQVINKDLNHWPGWSCGIGRQTLFIRFDEVWRAACRVGGLIGSIYDEQIALPISGVRCTAQSCNCIAGIKTAKSRGGTN